MANPVTVKYQGASAVVQNLDKVRGAVAEGVRKVILKTAWEVHNDAKRMCPVDTGRLRSSISVNWANSGMERGEVKGNVKMGKSGQPPKPLTPADGVGNPGEAMGGGFQAAVGTNVEYAKEVEDHVSPYLWPAFAMHKSSFANEMARVLKTEIEMVRVVPTSERED